MFKNFLFFSHPSILKKKFILLSSIGVHQGDSLIKPLFDFAHFCVLCCFSGVFASCLFFSLVDDTHIFGLVSIFTFAFDHFVSQLTFVGSTVQPHKCLIWSPLGFPPRFSLFNFCYTPNGIKF